MPTFTLYGPGGGASSETVVIGPAGPDNLFIQDTEPVTTPLRPYLWLDTSGPYLALYFEDGT